MNFLKMSVSTYYVVIFEKKKIKQEKRFCGQNITKKYTGYHIQYKNYKDVPIFVDTRTRYSKGMVKQIHKEGGGCNLENLSEIRWLVKVFSIILLLSCVARKNCYFIN